MITKIFKLFLLVIIASVFARFLINSSIKPSKEDFKKYEIHKALYGRGTYYVTNKYEFLNIADVVFYNGYFRIYKSHVDYYCFTKDKGYLWIPYNILKKLS